MGNGLGSCETEECRRSENTGRDSHETFIALCVAAGATCISESLCAQASATRVGGPREGCEAIYESPFPFERLASVDTAPDVRGGKNRLVIRGTVVERDGKTPAPGVATRSSLMMAPPSVRGNATDNTPREEVGSSPSCREPTDTPRPSVTSSSDSIPPTTPHVPDRQRVLHKASAET